MNPRPANRRRAVQIALCLMGCWLLAPAALLPAQTTRTDAAARSAAPRATGTRPATSGPRGDARAALDGLYQLAASAKTVAELNQALEQCEALRELDASQEVLAYRNQLEAWLLNRRGEDYSQSAGRAMEAGNDSEAIRLEQKAIADFSASVERLPQWKPFHNRGVSLAMLDRYDEAIASFDEAIQLNPTYPNTIFNRAELHLELTHFAQAERDYTEVLRLDESDTAARIGRGHARFYLEKFDQALEDFSHVIQQEPDNAIAHADRADLYAYLGRWEEAAVDYRQSIKIDKGLGRAYQSAAWLMATCPDDRIRNVEYALRAAKRAIELDGTADYRYLDTLAAAQANARQFREAQTALKQALELAPQDVLAELNDRLALYQAQRPFRDAAR
jgi:tetratricopeptide (TPR) repeat protein